MKSAPRHISPPTTNAEPVAIFPEGIGRSAVRFIKASVSDSNHWLSAATPPAANEVPIINNTSYEVEYTGLAAAYAASAVSTESRLKRGLVSSK